MHIIIDIFTFGDVMLFRELVVDNFAGWGGASTGIEWAMGRPVDIAINHNPTAIALHKVNHPNTRHFIEDVWDVNPRDAVNGMPVGLGWFSPDCKHHSKAKGSKPLDKKIRGLAWVACRWGATVKPRALMLENVPEFRHWGRLDENGKPIPNKKGLIFNQFYRTLRELGYSVEFEELKACDYGAPTIRNRLFMIARRDKGKIIWPEPTHGHARGLLPYRTASEIIDWSIPCKSIFGRKKSLAPKTLERIAKGIERFVMNGNPFIAPDVARIYPESNAIYGSVSHGKQNEYGLDHHLHNLARYEQPELVATFLAKHYTGVVGCRIDKALPTITTVDHNAVVTAAMIKRDFGCSIGSSLNQPIGSVVAGGMGKSALVTSSMIKLRNNNIGFATDEPVHTITAGGLHIGEVRTLLRKYGSGNNGAGAVSVNGEWYQIVDIGMRMLQPHELAAAQGFPPDYIIDKDLNGRAVTKTAQIAGIGNSVSPYIPEAMVKVNLPEMCEQGTAAA